MTAPTLGAYTTAQRTSNGTSLACNVPTYPRATCCMWCTPTTPARAAHPLTVRGGLPLSTTTIIAASGVADSGSLFVWKKVASGTSYTITSTVSERAVAVAFVVSGDGGINVGPTNSNGTTSTPAVADLTTTLAQCVRISIIAASADRTPVAPSAGTRC